MSTQKLAKTEKGVVADEQHDTHLHVDGPAMSQYSRDGSGFGPPSRTANKRLLVQDSSPPALDDTSDYNGFAMSRNLRDEQSKKQKRRKIRNISISVIVITLIATAIAAIVLGVLYAKKTAISKAPALTGVMTTSNLTTLSSDYRSALPITDSKLGATVITYSNMFTPSSNDSTTHLVYNTADGKICIRIKSGSGWFNNVRCINGANAMPNSPITVLDWLGGPSIYYLTASQKLSGIDHIPSSDTWKFSSITRYDIVVHDQSQIASVTWFNGTSSWVYYQQPDGHIREFGRDDYRDDNWRDGSIGPLGIATTGSGIGVSRWFNGTDEIEEVFFQQGQGTIAGRLYRQGAWGSDLYAIDGTSNNIAIAASVSLIAMPDAAGSSIDILTYVDKDGFISAQSRENFNASLSKLGSFSAPVQIMEGTGQSTFGLVAIGKKPGIPWLYASKKTSILELFSTVISGGNWTSTAT